MSRKRRAPASFEWRTVPEPVVDTPPQPDVHIRHSHLNFDQSGPSSIHTSYLSAPASPSKQAGPLDYDDNDYNWNSEPVPMETNATGQEFGDHDPAYLHFLDVNESQRPFQEISLVQDQCCGFALLDIQCCTKMCQVQTLLLY